MSEKKLMSDFFNKDTDKKMKNTNHKITLATAVELKSDLMTKPYMMNYSALITCCLFFKCPIYAVMEKNKTFLLFQPNDYVNDTDNAAEDPNAVVLYSEKGRMSMEMDATTKKNIIDSMIKTTDTDSDDIIVQLPISQTRIKKIINSNDFEFIHRAYDIININDVLDEIEFIFNL